MAVINLSNCRSFHASSRLPSAPYLLVDTIVLHDPKVIEPSKVLHDIWFLSQDTTIAQKKYSEWKLLHMDNVYIEALVINKDLYHFLCDTLGIDSKSYQWCYLNPNWENMYCLVFQVRADYHEKNFKILTELVKYEYRSPFPIYRPGYKYEYYQMLVEIPEEFYINHIRKGLVPIPFKHN